MTSGSGGAGEAGSDGAEILLDLPAPLWGPLLRAVRRAADSLGREALPVGLRPYAAFNPKRLAGERPLRAVAAALEADQRLCEAVGESLDSDLWAAAADTDPLRLSSLYTAADAVAGLAARRRFGDVATVAAAAVQQPARSIAAGEPPAPSFAPDRADRAAVSAARQDRDAARRRADAAEQRLRSATADLQRLHDQVAALRADRDRLDSELEQQRRQFRDRTARLRRRAESAERQAAASAQRLHEVTAPPTPASMQTPPRRPGAGGQILPRRPDADGHAPQAPAAGAGLTAPERGLREPGARSGGGAVPRTVRAATPGRPSALPPGLRGDEPDAVHALLKVPGLTVVLDGYNVTLSPRGMGTAALADQRAWLTRLACGLVARYGVRAIAVFDGARERAMVAAATRGVQVVFTASGQTADERIVEIVSSLGSDQPVAVVSSDREVCADCEAFGANVIASEAFVRAVA